MKSLKNPPRLAVDEMSHKNGLKTTFYLKISSCVLMHTHRMLSQQMAMRNLPISFRKSARCIFLHTEINRYEDDNEESPK